MLHAWFNNVICCTMKFSRDHELTIFSPLINEFQFFYNIIICQNFPKKIIPLNHSPNNYNHANDCFNVQSCSLSFFNIKNVFHVFHVFEKPYTSKNVILIIVVGVLNHGEKNFIFNYTGTYWIYCYYDLCIIISLRSTAFTSNAEYTFSSRCPNRKLI